MAAVQEGLKLKMSGLIISHNDDDDDDAWCDFYAYYQLYLHIGNMW